MKVAIIGAGNVGATTALRILQRDLADVVLFDVALELAQGKALDLMDSNAVSGINRNVSATKDYKDLKGSDIVVITAGFARKPGMTREDLLKANADVVKEVSSNIKNICNDAVVIVVTNPLDVMTYLVKTVTGFDRKKVLGMAGELDSARFKSVLKAMKGVDFNAVDAVILGGHSADLMVSSVSQMTINKKPIKAALSGEEIIALKEKTCQRGAEIIGFLKSGSAYYGPSAAIFKMVNTILSDKKDRIIASCLLEGEYGLDDVCIGVPVIVGRKGIEDIIKLDLGADELDSLKRSAALIRENIKKLEGI